MKEIFPNIRKWITSINKYKEPSCPNSSLKLWKERRYATELISVKSYKKGLKFLEVKTVKDITNHLQKLEKVFFIVANASVYCNAFQYTGAIKICKKFACT